MTTVRSSPAGRRAICLLALAIALASGLEVSAHRRDELLQAARLAIDPAAVRIELDLTPGIAVAETIIADIDRNHDGTISPDEQRDYADDVLARLQLEIDQAVLQPRFDASSFPDIEAMRRGVGTIRLASTASFPSMPPGSHQLLYRNRHHPDQSVYLANALVPVSDRVAVVAQRRDGDQRELIIDYAVRPRRAASPALWVLFIGGALSALWFGRRRKLIAEAQSETPESIAPVRAGRTAATASSPCRTRAW
jgi:hypothetical protein